MCGIIGYNGFRDANKVIIDCLKRLEYRGYDSVGIGIIGEKLQVYKDVGEISKLEKDVPDLKGDIGVGHSRWATHGAVTKENAHPQMSIDNKIAVIHNGIIENFKKLRTKALNLGLKQIQKLLLMLYLTITKEI